MKRIIILICIFELIFSSLLFSQGSFSVINIEPSIIFTPNGDNHNDEIILYYENPYSSPIAGRIYDLFGRFVNDLDKNEEEECLIWDGKDINGRKVNAGIYIYQIECGNKIVKGFVIVAR